ncbi:hypothetical protein X798_00100 [Onchocerca flexuosa]|uniref:ShKT domain-containing protein n=1 Tax=Onchocerca flexuosa TaxID=387005 RepID=A0A238C4W2_9BILA|nr:hypothetical protein X798_00100 [Onchocerca flexuosa]
MHILSSLITVFALLACCIGTQHKTRLAFCDQAPNSAFQIVCSQLKKWDSDARQHHSTSLNESWSLGSSQRIWSTGRSQWTNKFQSSTAWTTWTTWTAWSPWTLSHNLPSQGVPRNSHDKSALITNHHVDLPTLVRNFTVGTDTSKKPKRVILEIQHEFSSLPRQIKPIRVRGEQVMNVKTHFPHAVSSLLSSPKFAGQEQTSMTNQGFRKIINGVQRPPWTGTTKKDLYTMEQDTVGPPGQQLPNNLIRKQFSLASQPSMISSKQPSLIRMSDRSVESSAFSAEVDDNRLFKRNQSNMVTSSPLTSVLNGRLKALECMDLNCLCPFFHGSLTNLGCFSSSNGKEFSMAIRKEYRQLSADERQRFHSALNRLKRSGDYDKIAEWHSNPELSGGAHSGPAFLPWHREYLKRLEIALRLIDPDVSLPYWDSTLENMIPENTDTVLFSEELMGENDRNGNIINGFISHWITPKGRHVIRRFNQEGRPLNEDDIQAVMRHWDVIGVLAYTAPQPGCKYPTDWTSLEYSHANVLVWVGDDMFHQTTSANDPLFFLHHAFVDSIWEYWRQYRQSRDTRSRSYPPDLPECSGENHFAQNPMRPFEPLRNIDGISNNYNEKLYQYAPRPACARGQDEECESEFLFCDLSHGDARCSTKIRLGGKCDGYTHQENPCYNGNLSFQEQCYNSHECCSVWASKGECKTNEEIMLKWCSVSCHICTPQYDTTSGKFFGSIYML